MKRLIPPPCCSWRLAVFTFVLAGEVVGQPAATPDVRTSLEAAAVALERGDASSALEAVAAAQAVEPENPWLWFYKGRAEALRGYPHAAIEAMDRALEILVSLGDPDPPLAERIRDDRHMVQRQVLHQSVTLSFAYDSNVTFSSGGTAGLFIAGRGDTKFTSQWAFDYAPIATPLERLTLGGHLSNAWHFQIGEFNYQDYGAAIRYSRSLDDHWSFDLQYAYDITYLGNQPFLSNHSLSPALVYGWAATGEPVELSETRVDYRIDARDFLYETPAVLDRDGFANSVGIAQTFRFRPSNESPTVWDLYAGYRFHVVATQGSEFDRDTHGLYLKLAMPVATPWLPDKDAVLQLSASWEFDDYGERSVIDDLGRRRDDVITTAGLVLSQVLRSESQRGDMILHLIANWTDSDSDVRTFGGDASPFSYDKIVVGVQLEWRF